MLTYVLIIYFPGGSAGKESTCNVGDLGLIPGLGRSPREGKATHSSILALRIPWTASSMGSKSWTRLSDLHFTSLKHIIHAYYSVSLYNV